MNVLLINPLCRLPSYMLPLGLGYIAGVLRRDGHQVRILDINCYGYSQNEVEKIIAASRFDIVGIGGLTSTYKYVKWLAQVIKKYHPDVPMVAGNMVATTAPETLLNHSVVDVAVIDEGEDTFRELVSVVRNGFDLSAVKGIYFKDSGGSVIKNPPRERITDLDALPFPAWDLFNMQAYLYNSTHDSLTCGKRTMSVSSVRGCPYECSFCSHPFGRKVHMRSPQNLVAEIKELKKRYGVEFITSTDDLFFINEGWVREFCERLIAQRLGIEWSVPGRVNLVNERLLRLMRRAGCAEIGYGFESGSQRVLDRMKKRVSVPQAEEAIRMSRRAGIKVYGSIIFGMPGETRESIAETLNFIRRSRLPLFRFFYATPYPRTELYEIAKAMGRLPADEDAYLEKLGEMRVTFLVNLTEFSDKELVQLKQWAEEKALHNLPLVLRWQEFSGNWKRRLFIFLRNTMENGLRQSLKMFSAAARKKIFTRDRET